MSSSHFPAIGFPIAHRWVLMLLALVCANEGAAQVNQAPLILRHPESQTATAGSEVRFFVQAVGVEPLSYQWQFQDEDIPGATKSDLLLSNVQFRDSGHYTVVVANRFGEAISKPASLRVL